MRLAVLALAGSLGASAVSAPLEMDPAPGVAHPPRDDAKKGAHELPAPAVLGTLVDTHSLARVPFDELVPAPERFEALLSDPVLGGTHAIDPSLLGLVRALARRHDGVRVEVVSGYRSERLNELLRKKGHHVANHSQHSLGHALDFRLVLRGDDSPVDPRALAKEIRELGWRGGVGVYLGSDDRFVHADVGPERTWYGQ